jgi:hypothetical protein
MKCYSGGRIVHAVLRDEAIEMSQSDDQNKTISEIDRQGGKTSDPEELTLLPFSVRGRVARQRLGSLWWVQQTHSSFLRDKKEFIFEEGIVQTDGWVFAPAIKALYRWSDVRLLISRVENYMRYDRYRGSIYRQFTCTFEIEFHDGNKCSIVLPQPGVRTWDRDFFFYGTTLKARPSGSQDGSTRR